MKISLNTPARKWLLATGATLLACAYVIVAGRECLAAWFDGRAELASLQRAVRFDPGNADYRDHLGRYFALAVHDPATAIEPYRRAVELNPHSARYWFDLANAYQVMGDVANQTQALERAIQADPMTPDVAWQAANLYLVQGENDKALREFRVVLGSDSSLAGAAIQYCWRIQPDVDALLRDVVPARSDAYISFLSLLMNKEETSATAKVWNALIQGQQHFDLPYVFEYFRYLVLHKDAAQALLVWQQAASRFGLASYLPNHSNLIVNGNFDLDVLNGGLDWQYHKQPSVELTLDPGEFHGGRRSLRITFDGPGIRDAGVFQLIAVKPNTTYAFSAYYKNGELEGAGGPHMVIRDMYTQAIYYDSGELREAGFWKSVDGEFTTGPECALVMLHIPRLPEGSPMRGKLWVDDFHLVQKQSQ
jgi:tetratricopeptide (TPR) repeat protein